MVSVELRNPDIILTPITEEEKQQIESNFMGDESIYVLYRLPNLEEIHIGMMSSSMRRYFPITANVWNLEKSISKAFFYNGSSELKNKAPTITDRPVYRVIATDDRIVSGYDILNGTPENGLRICLEDVVDGNYTLNANELRKSR
ncbi:MAG TPA: hypothetical protein IAB56_03160 [Candidatus Scybalousia intestinigallinarum]|nr:hypothetical protein [Candidatus Scybalousia intestinigallinarum]